MTIDHEAEIARLTAALAQSRAETQAALAGCVKVSAIMWCDACRAVGAMHCAHPDECGNMISAQAHADSWKSWIDDLPLDAEFQPGLDRLQDFIDRILAAIQPDTSKLALVREAFLDCIDLLRSALAIAKREGIDGKVASTNWDAFYNRVSVTLKRHHALSNDVRAALALITAQEGK